MTRRAVYPGSFDPPTSGHVDIIRRAAELFDEVWVTVFDHPTKLGVLPPPERVALLQKLVAEWPGVHVDRSRSLLVDYCRHIGAHFVVRGLRGAADLEYEWPMTQMNRFLAPDIDTVFLLAAPQSAFVSSSLVRELSSYGAPLTGLVPPLVEEALNKRREGTPPDGQNGSVGIGTGQPD